MRDFQVWLATRRTMQTLAIKELNAVVAMPILIVWGVTVRYGPLDTYQVGEKAKYIVIQDA